MLKIKGMDIYYIRGDDDSFTIQPVQTDGTPIMGYTGVVSLTSANVTAALGYTPYNAANVVTYSALSQTEIDTCFA